MSPARRSAESYDRVPLAALLHATRGTYTAAIQRAQAKVGCDDVPASGEPILSAMEWSGASLEEVIRRLGVTKQAVSQSVETLVARGYLERARDSSDRRRVTLSLTPRGRIAGKAARAAIEQVDRDLQARVGADSIRRTRETLVALLEVKRKSQAQEAEEKE